ncbi:uncharacterized protein LOC127243744 [Andrographis paniculata]|uniref:uncharacterized protein LOC127243744 n=1 Tax=Andrographis paniculata TaxID=175694 RepID=UPI0021E793B3|nr:uncharacterized protein LOC127243744 [Andrographis paniculata]
MGDSRKSQSAIQALSAILPAAAGASSAAALLHDAAVAKEVSAHLRRADSGAVNDNLCAWLYDTFHSSDHDLQLVVLRFLPAVAGVYLSRAAAALNKPLAGFESVLLAVYAHVTAARNGQPVTAAIPDLAQPSVYHDGGGAAAKTLPQKSPAAASEPQLGVISASLEPHGTVRSTRRARIVGVGLELYYSRIAQIPLGSKIEFCHFCKIWSGQNLNIDSDLDKHDRKEGKLGGRINLPWELLQPILRILGHCLMGPEKNEELLEAAFKACQCLNSRALHDLNAKAVMATASLVKLAEIMRYGEADRSEIDTSNVMTV